MLNQSHEWRARIIRELQDISYSDEVLALPEDQQEAIDAVIERASSDLCEIAGHEPTRDQCGMPEHDFCVWCNKAMPGQWKAPTP